MITVIGSSNTDFTIKSPRIPGKGETVLGDEFIRASGGKGANQAVAAARLKAEVAFVGRIGVDVFGDKAINDLKASGVEVKYTIRDKLNHSGVALILVDKKADNIISVFPGSNGFLSKNDIIASEKVIAISQIVLLQLEIPLDAVNKAIELAYKNKTRVILNAAPAKELPEDMLLKVGIIVVNEKELEFLTKTETKDINAVYNASDKLLNKVKEAAIVTLGSRGAVIATKEGKDFIPAVDVEAVDTTAAGDAFVAALSVGLSEGRSLSESVLFANQVAALTTVKMGAQNSLPSRSEVENFINKKVDKINYL